MIEAGARLLDLPGTPERSRTSVHACAATIHPSIVTPGETYKLEAQVAKGQPEIEQLIRLYGGCWGEPEDLARFRGYDMPFWTEI